MGGNARKRLNEKELGSLYLLSETPIVVDRILKSNGYKDEDITVLHQSMAHHAPDMAMIAVSLSCNLIAEAMKQTGDGEMQPLAAELKYLSVNTLEEVGRIWIDACRYQVANEKDIHDIVHEAADILCMFASILLESAELATPDYPTIRAVTAALMYQCEAQADSARAMVDNAHPVPDKTSKDSIPLPAELYPAHYTDNIVTFSLFGPQAGGQ